MICVFVGVHVYCPCMYVYIWKYVYLPNWLKMSNATRLESFSVFCFCVVHACVAVIKLQVFINILCLLIVHHRETN